MGIEQHALHFLASSQKAGVSLKKSVTLGRQDLLLRPNHIKHIFNQYNIPISSEEIEHILNGENYFADLLFRKMGAEVIDSIDHTAFEGATIVHDMNQPMPVELKNSYSLVFDGGTLEHVFNFPQAIKNCMEMVQVGGHFLSVCPCDNMMGHGFYQFSPELFFRVFCEENGFVVESMFIHAAWQPGKWLKVADPDQIRQRVGCSSIDPMHIFLRARKVKDVPVFKTTPYQSDYASSWKNENDRDTNTGRLDFFYKQPESGKGVLGKILDCLPSKLSNNIRLIRRQLKMPRGVDQKMFQEIDLD
jgi:hypothetical protein